MGLVPQGNGGLGKKEGRTPLGAAGEWLLRGLLRPFSGGAGGPMDDNMTSSQPGGGGGGGGGDALGERNTLNAPRLAKGKGHHGKLGTNGRLDASEEECRLCQKEGELICCESCPAAFHLSCIGLQCAPSTPLRTLCGAGTTRSPTASEDDAREE